MCWTPTGVTLALHPSRVSTTLGSHKFQGGKEMKTGTNNRQIESFLILLIFLFIITLLSGCTGVSPTTDKRVTPYTETVISRKNVIITPKILYPVRPGQRKPAPQPIGVKTIPSDDGHLRIRVKDLPPWWQSLFTPQVTDRRALLEQEPANTKDLVVKNKGVASSFLTNYGRK